MPVNNINNDNNENERIDSYKVFEARLRDNKGLNSEYIDNIKDTEEREAHRKISTRQVEPPHRIIPLVDELMRLQGGRIQMTAQGPMPQWNDHAKKARIEELARSIIEEQYGRLLRSMNAEMDIQLVDMDELQDMKGGDEMEDSSPEPQPNMEEEELNDEDLANDIYKRKLVNVITQGSAKNTHRLIHLHRDSIENLDPDLFDTMDKLIKAQETAEWTFPENDDNGKMIRQFMNGYTKVEFGDDEDEDGNDQEEIDENLEDVDMEALLNGDEDEMENLEEQMEDYSGTIKITARAIDLTVLLHESVKGIYEILGAPSIPENDEERANNIMINTDTLQDEFEDLRYGPKIREDLLTFVNSNDKVNQVEDGFEWIWNRMASTDSETFLELFLDILINKTGMAENWLDQTLNELIESDEELRRQQYAWDEENNDREEWKGEESDQSVVDEDEDEEDLMSQLGLDDDDDDSKDSDNSGEVDYSTYNKRDLEELLNQAIDDGNFPLAAEIGKHM